MRTILSWFFMVLYFVSAENDKNWNLAVTVSNKILLLDLNGTMIASKVQKFNKVQALAFDNLTNKFIVSDMDNNYGNESIFILNSTKETKSASIIQNLEGNIQGLSFDPFLNTIYWTDSKNRSIRYAKLVSNFDQNILFDCGEAVPKGITIDICGRHLYWTNSNTKNAKIERCGLDGSNRESIISKNIHSPQGIIFDHIDKRIYWVDIKEGIDYTIESSDLTGADRKIIYRDTHSRPFGIAVNEFNIYWTDKSNRALFVISKANANGFSARKLNSFPEEPIGLIAKYVQPRSQLDCKILPETYKNHTLNIDNDKKPHSKNSMELCLNNGTFQNGSCICEPGFDGLYCEVSVCQNYCLHGSCSFTENGKIICHCPNGLSGDRCEQDVCQNYCLNQGTCYSSQNTPKCICKEGYIGTRCELEDNFSNICEVYCKNNQNDILASTNTELTCTCVEGTYRISKTNTTYKILSASIEEKLRDPIFIVQLSCIIACTIVIVVLVIYIRNIRKKRPRIKKRIIVNKNIQPLTYRPQPSTESCEITIENCCNMNVCETPCFEPTRADDKRVLLANMEDGDDLN